MQIYYCYHMIQVDETFGKSTVTYDKKKTGKLLTMNMIATSLILIRGFFILRVFTPLRPLIRMIKEVIKELGSFTILLFISLFFFSVLTFTLLRTVEEAKGKTKGKV